MSQYHLVTAPSLCCIWLAEICDCPTEQEGGPGLEKHVLELNLKCLLYTYICVYIYMHYGEDLDILKASCVMVSSITLLHQLPSEEPVELVPNKPAALLYNFIYIYVF